MILHLLRSRAAARRLTGCHSSCCHKAQNIVVPFSGNLPAKPPSTLTAASNAQRLCCCFPTALLHSRRPRAWCLPEAGARTWKTCQNCGAPTTRPPASACHAVGSMMFCCTLMAPGQQRTGSLAATAAAAKRRKISWRLLRQPARNSAKHLLSCLKHTEDMLSLPTYPAVLPAAACMVPS